MRIHDFEDSRFTCKDCGHTFILCYMSPENDDICIFCDSDLDYEDNYYSDEENGN